VVAQHCPSASDVRATGKADALVDASATAMHRVVTDGNMKRAHGPLCGAGAVPSCLVSSHRVVAGIGCLEKCDAKT